MSSLSFAWGRRAVRAALTSAACMVAFGAPASAQQGGGNTVIGPSGLGGFNLQPQRRIVTQPTPAPQPPAQPTPQPTQPRAEPAARPQATSGRTAAPVSRTPRADTAVQRPTAPVADPGAAPAADTTQAPISTLPAAPVDAQPVPAPVAPPASAPDLPSGPPIWLYLLGGALLGLGGYAYLARRRAAERRALAIPAPEMPTPQPSEPRAPRPDPVPRPWIEIDLHAERATADAKESVVEFEMTIRNSGGSVARNIRMQAKLICGTLEQDKEILDFHRKKPGEHRTLSMPDLPPGEEIRIKGRVDIKGEELKALRVEERLLFIPLVAVNAFYEFGSGRTGQTSKSFLVGREKPDPADRMAPFRLDLGPRVYRTVSQRPYKIERRV